MFDEFLKELNLLTFIVILDLQFQVQLKCFHDLECPKMAIVYAGLNGSSPTNPGTLLECVQHYMMINR